MIYDWAFYVLSGLVVLLAIAWLVVGIQDMRWAWRTRDAPWNRRRK